MTKLKNVLHSYAIGMGIKGIWKHARISGTPHSTLTSQKTDLR